MSGAILTAVDLAYHVGATPLVDGVNLTLAAGELHAVLGRNGAGKSTLLKLLTGELRPSHGTVSLWERPLRAFKLRELALRRAVLAQHTDLNFDYQVLEVALLGRLPHQRHRMESREDARIAAENLDRVGLAGYEGRSYLTLSGGEQQRTHLARVLSQLSGTAGERLLFLDEPTSSLDLHHQHQVLELARALTREGVSVFAVLHDLNLAARYADRITLLSQGRVAASGTPEAVLQEAMLTEIFQQSLLVTRHPCLDCPLVVSR